MKVLLTLDEEDAGGAKAQTGNLVHRAVEQFHKNANSEEAGRAALEAARLEFPKGDPKEAGKQFAAYATDPENLRPGLVTHAEEKVRLVLACAPGDLTGEPIVIEGTLDQIRLDFEIDRDKFPGYSVWDIKTGTMLDAGQSLAEHLAQQACYVLAARQTLGLDVRPGGLILTPGYAKPRGRRFVPTKLTVEQCEAQLAVVPHLVSLIRQGIPVYGPSAENCKWCSVAPYTNCMAMYKGLYGGHR